MVGDNPVYHPFRFLHLETNTLAETWDYQFTDQNPTPPPKRSGTTKSTTGPRSLASFFFGTPSVSGATHNRTSTNPHRPPTFPPPPKEDESRSTTNSSSTDDTADRRRPKVPFARSSGTTFPSSVSTGKGKGSSLSIVSSDKVSSLARHEEGLSLENLPNTTKSKKSTLNQTSKNGSRSKNQNSNNIKLGTGKVLKPLILTVSPKQQQQQQQQQQQPKSKPKPAGHTTVISLSMPKPTRRPNSVAMTGAIPGAKGATATADNNGSSANFATIQNAKKLHSRVKSEKELRIDTKKRVKGWLKDVGEEAPEPPAWDSQGLPIYT